VSSERAFIVVIGEAAALRWVLENRRMAFPEARRRVARSLRDSDLLFLYTTRGAFHNPTGHRGRIIGVAHPASAVRDLDPPIVLAGRSFATGCALKIISLAPFGLGVELAPIVPELRTFPKPRAWSASMRRALVPVAQEDVGRLRSLTSALPAMRNATIQTYMRSPSFAGKTAAS
jgi:hypothetical protein